MKRVGLTGSIGAGKSVAAAWLRARGVPVHEADIAVHEIYARPEVLAWLGENFPGALRAGTLSRAHLAEIIYTDEKMRKLLEDYIHPLVRADSADFARRAENKSDIIVFDIPLLFETGRDAEMNETWLITAPPDVRRARVLATREITAEKFEAINRAQMPDQEKRARADRVIENTGTLDAFYEKLACLIGPK